ncbi:MAG: hypothetical protein AAF705_12395, partial [Bacteroidota bacterium]
EEGLTDFLNLLNKSEGSITKIQSFIATVFFGSPNNKCAGHGICKIYKIGEEPPLENLSCPKRTIARVSLWSNATISLEVLKSSMPHQLKQQHFSKDLFEVEQEFDFSPLFKGEIIKKIQSGFYPYQENDRFIRLDF